MKCYKTSTQIYFTQVDIVGLLIIVNVIESICLMLVESHLKIAISVRIAGIVMRL